MKNKPFAFVMAVLCVILSILNCSITVAAEEATSNVVPSDAVEFNGASYKVYKQKMTWEQAKEYCESLGGHLVTITSQEEQDFVSALVTQKNIAAWIGAYLSNSKFVWVTGEVFEYTNWDQGEPSYSYGSSEKEPYVGIYANDTDTKYSTTGKWNDFRGSTDTVKGFVCEWEPQCITADGQSYATHENLYWSTTIEPTCLNTGEREQRCGRCQSIVQKGSIEALKHIESSWIVVQEPSCSATGIRQRVCERCDDVLTEEHIEAIGHVYGDWRVVGGSKLIPPIVKEHTCQVCFHSEQYKDWQYVWIPIVATVACIGLAIGIINYIRAFKKR